MRFLRYPGGKSKLLSFLVDYLPNGNEIKGQYIEPFVGGGSVFLHLNPSNPVLADLNAELIDLYKSIKSYPHKVWELFESFPSGKKAYYIIRDCNNSNKPIYFRAARTLYLNRTCFKGMWRHSPNGNFNVGYGGEERRWAVTHENIVELSRRLREARIFQADFEMTLDMCSNGDFIFLDPPYKPGEKEMHQAHYINGHFSFDDQKRLASKVKSISKNKNVKWVMTNSSNSDICKLYKDFNITKIPKGTSRVVGVFSNNSYEVLISNY